MSESTAAAAVPIEEIGAIKIDPARPETKPSTKYDRSIVEGPLSRAVWKLAWPTMLTNMISGLQGIVDHILVGHLVGFTGNAAIGVSFQIFLVVAVFISSLFIGMNVLVARFAGAGEEDKVNHAAYQGFLTAIFMALVILAPIGYFAAPYLLDLVNAEATVKTEALPFLRIMMTCSVGMMIYFMLSGALRSAGDARTPMVLGVVMTLLNLGLSFVLIRGLGPIPAFGTAGSAMGTCIASGVVGAYALYKLWNGGWVVSFPKDRNYAPDWDTIKSLFKFGLPAGFQGIAMNIGGVALLAFIGSLAHSAEAQAAYAVSYTQLFSLVTWTSVGLMGAAAAVAGQNLGAGRPDRTNAAVHIAARFGLMGAAFVGLFFFFMPELLLAVFGMKDETAVAIGVQLLRVLSVSGLFVTVALTYTGGLQGTGDTKGPMYISIISQVLVPLGICAVIKRFWTLDPMDIWFAILAAHFARCTLSIIRFRQGRWRRISLDGAS